MPIEMQVKEDFSVAPVRWNYTEVKREIAERVEPYKTVLVTEDAIPGAKSDLANLRKASKAINDRKIEIKKEFEKPYKEFEAQVKDVLAVIDEGIGNIDRQIKAFDEAKKDEKRKEILRFYELASADLPKEVSLNRIWNTKWENAGYKMPDIESEISAILNRLRKDIETVKGMKSANEASLLNTLYMTLDISEVVRHEQTLVSIAEANKRTIEDAFPAIDDPVPDSEPTKEPIVISTPEPLQQIDIRIWCTNDQKAAFRKFLFDNGIRYGSVR